MVMAHMLGESRLALKPLARQLLGVEVLEYEEARAAGGAGHTLPLPVRGYVPAEAGAAGGGSASPDPARFSIGRALDRYRPASTNPKACYIREAPFSSDAAEFWGSGRPRNMPSGVTALRPRAQRRSRHRAVWPGRHSPVVDDVGIALIRQPGRGFVTK